MKWWTDYTWRCQRCGLSVEPYETHDSEKCSKSLFVTPAAEGNASHTAAKSLIESQSEKVDLVK